MNDYREWEYDPLVGLYFYKGVGQGYTWREVEEIEAVAEKGEYDKRRTNAR